jgi:hypothetical protein
VKALHDHAPVSVECSLNVLVSKCSSTIVLYELVGEVMRPRVGGRIVEVVNLTPIIADLLVELRKPSLTANYRHYYGRLANSRLQFV